MADSNQNYYNDSRHPDSNLFNDLLPVRYAGFWERFAAALIDGIIIGVIGAIVDSITGSGSIYTGRSAGNFSVNYVTYYGSAGGLINLAIGWLYEAIMISGTSQATLGKMALGIKVTDLEGRRISFLNATGRHFAKILSAIILLIGYLMMLWDDHKQTLHDKLAGTLVVKK